MFSVRLRSPLGITRGNSLLDVYFNLLEPPTVRVLGPLVENFAGITPPGVRSAAGLGGGEVQGQEEV